MLNMLSRMDDPFHNAVLGLSTGANTITLLLGYNSN